MCTLIQFLYVAVRDRNTDRLLDEKISIHSLSCSAEEREKQSRMSTVIYITVTASVRIASARPWRTSLPADVCPPPHQHSCKGRRCPTTKILLCHPDLSYYERWYGFPSVLSFRSVGVWCHERMRYWNNLFNFIISWNVESAHIAL